jgi:predicted dehydrogenase
VDKIGQFPINDIAMFNRVRWGILGTGKIAHQFAAALRRLPEAELLAVGSRSMESATRFADEFGISRRYGSYAELVNDPQVEVIYVATPHSCHSENTRLALNAGKTVLCEKPFTLNAAQAREVIALARERKLFLMEAMWTRCFPLMRKLRELLASGAIGEVRQLAADFGFRAEREEEPRLFGPEFGGGALLDVGVYPVSLASMLFGTPVKIVSTANLGPTGVDEEAAMILIYDRGEMAILHAAIRLETAQEAIITGTRGRIRIHSPWWRPAAMTLSRDGKSDERFDFPLDGNGYEYEAQEVMDCLRSGKLESPLMPLDESLSIIETLDTLRAQWGLRYPME